MARGLPAPRGEAGGRRKADPGLAGVSRGSRTAPSNGAAPGFRGGNSPAPAEAAPPPPTRRLTSSEPSSVPMAERRTREGKEKPKGEPHGREATKRETKRKNKEFFQQEAARLRNLQPLRRAGHISLNIRSWLSGEERPIALKVDSSYSALYHAARTVWNKPTHATSISMRLWDPEDTTYTITAPGKAKVNRWMDGRTLCIHFYS